MSWGCSLRTHCIVGKSLEKNPTILQGLAHHSQLGGAVA